MIIGNEGECLRDVLGWWWAVYISGNWSFVVFELYSVDEDDGSAAERSGAADSAQTE